LILSLVFNSAYTKNYLRRMRVQLQSASALIKRNNLLLNGATMQRERIAKLISLICVMISILGLFFLLMN